MESEIREQTIELDAPPGRTRPDALLVDVLKGTGIEPREPVSRFFGCWTWDYTDVPAEVWDAANPTIAARCKALFHSGAVRFASW